MSSVSQVGERLHGVLEERACVLARETGCVKRQRKFSGADLVQTLVFGFQQHPHASLESLASTAEIRDVSVSDSAVDKRFTPECARLLHGVVEELTSIVVEAAQDVPIKLLRRFSAVILQDSSRIRLPAHPSTIQRAHPNQHKPGLTEASPKRINVETHHTAYCDPGKM